MRAGGLTPLGNTITASSKGTEVLHELAGGGMAGKEAQMADVRIRRRGRLLRKAAKQTEEVEGQRTRKEGYRRSIMLYEGVAEREE